MPGLSGFSVYLPPYRVQLKDWCDWYGQPWDKIKAVVGRSFRVRGPAENVYTMAASALLRLILNYQLDPQQIGFLALGTESSTDNSAGSVVVKGLVNQALNNLGMAEIARNCEVPEFKHACLGGVYGIKNGLRYLACNENPDQVAVVISADIAEYARGSTGEPTQGAGAVAVLLDQRARLATLDLARAGSSSDYRAVDFRKPLGRLVGEQQRINGQIRDFPVFNGKYSTTCYIEATLRATMDMLARKQTISNSLDEDLRSVFMHRPYRKMPEAGLAHAWLLSLALARKQGLVKFEKLAAEANINPRELREELTSSPRLLDLVEQRRLSEETFPLTRAVIKAIKSGPEYRKGVLDHLELGSDLMMDFGNLYTAALPAWMAAGFTEAAAGDEDLSGKQFLLFGYGSGDAAEVIPMEVCQTWREAAAPIGFVAAEQDAIDLRREQYEALHDFGFCESLPEPAGLLFLLDRIGTEKSGDYQDYGIEYYRCNVGATAS